MRSNWQTQLNILWLGQALLMAVLAMSLPYWPLYIAKLGHFTPQTLRYWSGAVYIAPFLTATLSAPFWGKMGDRYGYKPMVIRACLGLFITQTLILFCHEVWLIFIIRLLQGLLAGFTAAAQAWALAISPTEKSSATIGKLQSATAIGALIGPLLGASIVVLFGYYAVFTLSVVICAAILLLFLTMLERSPVIPTEKQASFSLFKVKDWGGMGHFITSLLLVMIIVQFARTVITPVFALFVIEKLGGNEMTVGVLYAATGLMIFISAPVWGKWFDNIANNGNIMHVAIASILFVCAILNVLQAYAGNATEVFILRLLWGVCLGAILPILLRFVVDRAQLTQRGMFLGLSNSATRTGDVLGILLGTLIETHLGYADSFFVIAALYCLAAFVLLFHLKSQNIAIERPMQ